MTGPDFPERFSIIGQTLLDNLWWCSSSDMVMQTKGPRATKEERLRNEFSVFFNPEDLVLLQIDGRLEKG